MKISACVIAKNEAENLPRWLASMRVFADEMIVVDTGSTDATVEIARAGGARVCHFDWINDFAAAKNFALDQAQGDWVVFTDADEYFTEESEPRVRPLIEEYDKKRRWTGSSYISSILTWIRVLSWGHPPRFSVSFVVHRISALWGAFTNMWRISAAIRGAR